MKDNRKMIRFPGCQTREGLDFLVDIYMRDLSLKQRGPVSKKVAKQVAALRSLANRILNPLIK